VNSYSPKSKRALVLSAGGMFGAYQAGAWEVLHQDFKPDLVVGASIGSLNGYMIASGCAPSEVIARWLSLGEAGEVRWRVSTRSLIDASPMDAFLQEVCSREPECEYALVATESRTGRPRIFQSPGITWRHLAASCGVPFFLPAQRIDGVLYSDGGLIDPLPLWAALELGATEIVAVDVMKHRPRAVQAAVGMLQAWARYRRPETAGMSMLEISPSERLGSVRDCIYWTRANSDRWISLGREDARRSLKQRIKLDAVS
jgi:NTE family protein